VKAAEPDFITVTEHLGRVRSLRHAPFWPARASRIFVASRYLAGPGQIHQLVARAKPKTAQGLQPGALSRVLTSGFFPAPGGLNAIKHPSSPGCPGRTPIKPALTGSPIKPRSDRISIKPARRVRSCRPDRICVERARRVRSPTRSSPRSRPWPSASYSCSSATVLAGSLSSLLVAYAPRQGSRPRCRPRPQRDLLLLVGDRPCRISGQACSSRTLLSAVAGADVATLGEDREHRRRVTPRPLRHSTS